MMSDWTAWEYAGAVFVTVVALFFITVVIVAICTKPCKPTEEEIERAALSFLQVLRGKPEQQTLVVPNGFGHPSFHEAGVSVPFFYDKPLDKFLRERGFISIIQAHPRARVYKLTSRGKVWMENVEVSHD